MSTNSKVRNENGKTVAVDYKNGDNTYRYSVYSGSDTPKKLIGVQNHENGKFRETCGTDIFGFPIYKKK